jgi:rubrerythrin
MDEFEKQITGIRGYYWGNNDGTFVDGIQEGLHKALEIYRETKRKKCKAEPISHSKDCDTFRCSLCLVVGVKKNDTYCPNCGAAVGK